MRTLVTTFFALLLSGICLADDLTIPNTFTAGTPARAADVNANFTAVEASVDDNAADIVGNSANIESNTTAIAVNSGNISSNLTATENNAASIASLTLGSGVHVYSQGVSIGRFLGAAFADGTNAVSAGPAIWLVSDSGFVFTVDVGGSSPRFLTPVNNLYYLEPNCQGDAFIGPSYLGWTASSGAVFRSPLAEGTAIYYTERGQFSTDRLALSEYEDGVGCRGITSNNANFRAFPNDPAVTGVPNTAPVRPYTIGVP